MERRGTNAGRLAFAVPSGGVGSIDVLSDLFTLRGIPGHIRSDNGPEFIAKALREWIAAVGAKTYAWKPMGEWLLRELQLKASRRAA
ncbi:transposase InsO family protein [Phyllobacterium trifolii]|uniref:Transposase InsO family protein n=1 Tax=Phyllobacterium trifolii TaxID=300193 RepID=A0A839UEG2_9HYPH|nr:transposase InsO family protein [Phyllobacterium trifolii]